MYLKGWMIATLASLAVSPLGLSGFDPVASAHIPPAVTLNQRTLILTEAKIRQLADTMQTAVDQRNASGVMKFIAPKVAIDITLQSAMGTQQLRPTRAEYERSLREGFALIDRYTGKIANLKIQIAPDRKSAIATYLLTEETTLKQQPLTLTSSSNVMTRLEVMQDQILITAIKSTTKIVVKQG